jgi:hypothetical protein
MVLAHATQSQLARYVEYLKAENQVLRSKLPKRVICTPGERQRLVNLGKPLGSAIKDLISIVTPRSFARWVSWHCPSPARNLSVPCEIRCATRCSLRQSFLASVMNDAG